MTHLFFVVPGEPHTKGSASYLRYSAAVLRAAQAEMSTPPVLDPVAVDVTWVLSRDRRVDLDNLTKLLFDALTGTVWMDDQQVHRLTARKEFAGPNEPSRTEVTIDPLEMSDAA